MNPPTIRGRIVRRILVNFRVDPAVIQPLLPAPFRPKLLGDAAVAGICLIRLSEIRPQAVAVPLGLASENAAHRIAVEWTDAHGDRREGVYIPRRDTSSLVNHLAGGRLLPGEHQHACFDVADRGDTIDLSMRSDDGLAEVRLRAHAAEALPATSRFASLDEASAFFRAGAVGYSACRDASRLDGLRLATETWRITPLAVETVYSSFFADERRFPAGSVEFDCALIMRDIPHAWQPLPSLDAGSGYRPAVEAVSPTSVR